MDIHTLLLIMLVILATSRLFAEVATRLKAPSVIGELVAGVVLGPSLLGWIEPLESVRLLAEIGIILLLFDVGLGTDVKRLVQSGWSSLIVAAGGFVAPFVLGTWLGYAVFDLSLLVSLFIGGTLTATSIGVTVRVLQDLQAQHGREGQAVLGAAVLDDILGVLLLAVLYEFATGGGVGLVNFTKILLFLAVFFAIAPVAVKLISLIIRRVEGTSEIPGLIPVMIVSLVLFFAWLAKEIGAPELLGGFAAGLALSRRFFLPLGVALHTDPGFGDRIQEQMRPIVYLFTPFFFVVVGLSLHLREIDWGSLYIWTFSAAVLLVAVVGKFAGALLLRQPMCSRVVIGVAMIPRGEVGLVFAELGRSSGVFDNEIYAGMVIVIALTTVVSPFVLKAVYAWYGPRLLGRDGAAVARGSPT
jgi:Kef-type K+ transport system membrane component KefB